MTTEGICKECGNPFLQNSANHETCHWCKYYKKEGKKNPLAKKGYPMYGGKK